MQILVGDCVQVMETFLPDQSVDSCVTDPPYGIGFMGRKWDTFKPGVAEKRIVPNQAVESDNPNLKGRARSPASSPSAVEYNRSLEGQREFQSWTEGWAREVLRVLKPGAHLLVCGAPRSFHRMASGIEDAGFEIRDCFMWVFGSGFPKSHNLKGEWDGWGTALKPAWEPIIVARKPLIGTVAANVEQHGTGALNITACRIQTDEILNGGAYSENRKPSDSEWGTIHSSTGRDYEQPLGRWPANLIHDGSEEVLALFPESAGQMGDLRGHSKDRKSKGIYGDMSAAHDALKRGDSGSAARFFYCAKASKQDRNEGCEGLPQKPSGMVSNTSGQHITRRDGGAPGPQSNNHPTVKPTALMRYLCRLVTPPGGIILDPFMGSGSTGKAALLEGFDFIGIEREPAYADIARKRVAA